MKVRHLIFAIMLFLIAVGGVIGYALHRTFKSYGGPIHIFALSNAPPFLTESLALSNARETLRLDGLDPAMWQACVDRRTKAPDGNVDEFLSRNTATPNHGVIMFTNLHASLPVRFVSIELQGGRLVCQTTTGK
jgi:hypothetical protein